MVFADDTSGRLVYFDTSVFDPDHGLQDAQESLVLDALYSQRFRLVFDLDCFLEPLLAFRAIGADTTRKAERQLQRMLKWCDRRRVVGLPEWLLADAVLLYSGHNIRENEFVDRGQLDQELERELKDWDSVRSPRCTFWQSIAHDVQCDRERYQNSITQLLQELGPRDGFSQGGTIPTFAQFFNEYRHRVTQTLVERVGHDKNQSDLWKLCIDRGIDGLLDIRCVRLAVGAIITLMYSHFYNAGQQIPKVRQSDAADIRHVIAASAAEIFVSNDLRLCKRLSVVPMNDGFRVLHLDRFLSDLKSVDTPLWRRNQRAL
jgi:hypothetical protein